MSVASPVVDYIDPSASPRRIYLLAGITEYHPVEDIYIEVRNIRRTDEAMRPYDIFVSGGGNLPKNEAKTKRTPRYAVFNNTKIILTGDTVITGEQLYADDTGALVGSGKDCIDRALSPADAYAEYEPPKAEVIVVNSGSGLSTEQDTKLTQLHGQSRRTLWINPALPADGNGYQQSPYKLVNSFIDDAEANGITLGYTLGDITLLKPMKNIILEGIGTPSFNAAGFDLKGMKFRYIKFDGASSGANRFILEHCELTEGAGIHGKADRCTLHGNISLTGNTHIIDGKSNIEGAGYYSVDTNGFILQVTNWRRSLGISNMTAGIHTVEMYGGQLRLDAGCSGGTIYLRGNYSKKPENLGTTIIIDQTEKANLLGTESFP